MTDTFRNQLFLVNEGLNPQNVLDYFYESHFYLNCGGPASLNEQQRRGLPIDNSVSSAEWFELVFSNSEAKSGFVDESIFVIQKFQKTAVTKRIPRDVFYVISGTIASAPSLGMFLDRICANTAVHFAEIYQLVREARKPQNPLGSVEHNAGWPDFVVFNDPPAVDIAQVSLAFKDEINS